MLKIIIVEDNSKHLEAISFYINSYLIQAGIHGKILLETGDPKEVLEFVKGSGSSPNVFFIDIDLNSTINGMELAQEIKQILNKAYIIFITHYLKYQQCAFRIHAYEFLPKPVTKEYLNKCIRDIYNELSETTFGNECDEDKMIIKSGHKDLYIKKHEILFIEKQGNKALVNTLKSQCTCYLPLEHFEQAFSNDRNLLRCHKSFIVNKDYIKEIRFNKLEIELITGKVCYMSRKYKKGLEI
ncbi:MAG: LytR/AlgR family response regulator transcription factor [Bacillota bacterium]